MRTGCFLILTIIAFTPVTICAQPDEEFISEIILDEQSENALFGISIIDSNGKEIYARNSRVKLIPASTLKLVTTLASLDILGDNYQYNTQVGITGELLEDGTLNGNVIIKGSGDPSLGSPKYPNTPSMEQVLAHIYQTVIAAGIKCIDGDVIVEGSIFDQNPIHPSWAWDDLTNYYASGAWGFNFHENFYYLHFDQNTTEGSITKINSIAPEVPKMSIDNHVLIGPKGSGDNAYIFGDPLNYIRWVSGTIPPGNGTFTIKGAIPNPLDFAAHHIYTYFKEKGLSAHKGAVGWGKDDIRWIGSLKSDNLFELVRYANEYSNNIFCEAFLKSVPIQENSGFEQGIKIVRDHLVSLGLDASQCNQVDGSGLSARNRVTPYFLSSLVNHYMSTFGVIKMKKIIPHVGEKGSVRYFLRGYSAQQNTWLKSGSINHVQGYAGIMESNTGKYFSISVLANGHNSNRKLRGQISKIIQHLYETL